MNNLYYFESGKILCWVAGYTPDESTMNLQEKINHLAGCGNQFAKMAGVDFSKVNTDYVTKSSRFKYMRLFYANVEQIPKDAMAMGKEWNLWSWIEN